MKPLYSLVPASLAVVLLAGCATLVPPSFAPGTGMSEVESRMGRPGNVVKAPDGDTVWQYPSGPVGQTTEATVVRVTDGDTIVHFKKANVVHMGDCFFNGMYPFIDLSSGGSIDGVIAAADQVLGIVDMNTKIIPGHGPVGDKAALQIYRDVLATVRDRVKAMVAAGKTLDQVKAAQSATLG